MIKVFTLIVELAILALALWLGNRLWWHRYGGAKKSVVYVLLGCAALIAVSAAQAAPTPTRLVTLTALDQRHTGAEEGNIYLDKLLVDGMEVDLSTPDDGGWTFYNGRYCWFEPGHQWRDADQSNSVTYSVKAGVKTQVVFLGNPWKGAVRVQIGNYQEDVDTWSENEKGKRITVELPSPGMGAIALRIGITLACFALVLLVLCAAATLLLELFGKVSAHISGKLLQKGPLRKLANYQFLFEELVKRDFKKKYKRTVLGMAWSVLSPLLTLLVMRLVFTQFFGRGTAHYTTYLFCGNLVYSYFNESTSQGMTSLMGNAGIFTKVNVPKYLFLFSKNVQTLINFGLTLCVFFVFCVLDNITFTWKLLCLIYPVVCLVLFNIGVGLILSALFVFFRDIQYLWSVFTLLLMYMSAIFYTIDSYSPTVQNLFLLNPVYLFIRYFRKIVIDATIPSLWFHLLMLAYVAIVLAIGYRMYKKNNTKFLYYV